MRSVLFRRSFTAIGILAASAAAPAAAQHVFETEDPLSIYESACAACHGESGDAIEGIDLGRGVFRRPLSDRELADIIMHGIPGTEMGPADLDEDEIEELVLFLRDNARPHDEPRLAGDAERGKALFEGKGECTNCHRIDGRGGRIGPDLSRIGRFRRAGHLMTSILDPALEVQPHNRFYRVVTRSGEERKGRLLNHDSFTVQLLDLDERLRSFEKADLVEHGFIDTLMPSYRDKLTEQEIADLVAYLASRRGT